MAHPFPHFHVASTDPFERGEQLGSQAKDYINGSLEYYRESFRYNAGLTWPDVRDLAIRFRGSIGEYNRAILAEMDGIASGASLPAEDILAINVRTEIMFGLSTGAVPECTSFYVGPDASANGHVLVGQNWDWHPHAEKTTVLVEVEQGELPSFVMLTEAGLVGKLGFNEAGVGLAVNFLLSAADRAEVRVPFHVIQREILNSRSLDEAVTAVVRSKRDCLGELPDRERRRCGR